MAALPNSQPAVDTVHYYHADAYVLDGSLEQPVQTEFKKQILVELPQSGKIQYERAIPYQLKGLISYGGGYTQVSGHQSTKAAGGFTTVATSVVEHLNVLDVLTADRVVGQISTTHPPYDPEKGLTDTVPSVSFLGTRFDNLKINGHAIEPERHLEIVGPKPSGAASYFDEKDFLDGIEEQYTSISGVVGLPEWAGKQYRWSRAAVQTPDAKGCSTVECSLISGIKSAPKVSFGHVIDLPHFGKIFLGELRVDRQAGQPATTQAGPTADAYTFHLSMIRLEMGCLAKGTAKVVALDANGTGGKGSGGH